MQEENEILINEFKRKHHLFLLQEKMFFSFASDQLMMQQRCQNLNFYGSDAGLAQSKSALFKPELLRTADPRNLRSFSAAAGKGS